MQTYFSFYDKNKEIKEYAHLEYLKEFTVEELSDIEFVKSYIEDLIFDKYLVLSGEFPDPDIAEEIDQAIEYLLDLHDAKNQSLKAWVKLIDAQIKSLNI